MKSRSLLIVAIFLFTSLFSFAQYKIVIPAGTPEDKALTEISNESDAAKRVTMLEDFVAKFTANKPALAYGYWQLSQQFISSDPAKALDYGDKALAAMPDVVDILQSQTDVAQAQKNYAKVVDYAVSGATVIRNLEKQPKGSDETDEAFKQRIDSDKASFQPVFNYMETAAYNAVVSETDPKKQLAEAEKFGEAFKGESLAAQANVLAVRALAGMNDMPKLMSVGEKALAADPNNVQLLSLMANSYAEDQKAANLAKAETYSRKVIELAKNEPGVTDDQKKITEGFAHEILGYTLMRQEKTAAAIPELKTATEMVKSDPNIYSVASFRLGFALQKSKRVPEAKEVLAQCAATDGPFKEEARKLLERLNAPAGARKK